MDNFDINPAGSEDPNKPTPFDDKPIQFDDKPIPFDDSDMPKTDISHSPLKLNDKTAARMPKIEMPKTVQKPTEKIVSTDRITGVKTFFTKLHVGSIDFLNEQINSWLKKNPGVVIKRTDSVTGMVAGKKTEPNIIITVWY